MALQKQTIQIPLTALREDVDDKMLPDGAFTVLENAQFDKQGRISKRDGYVALSSSQDIGGDSIVSGSYLVPTNDSLLLFDGRHAWSKRQGTDSDWHKHNPFIPCSVSVDDILGDPRGKVFFGGAVSDDGDVEAYLYGTENPADPTRTYSGNLYLALYDKNAKSILKKIVPSTSIYEAKIVWADSAFNVVYWKTDGVLYIARYDKDGQEVLSETSLFSNIDAKKKLLEVSALSSNRLMVTATVTSPDDHVYAEIFNCSDPTTTLASGDLGTDASGSLCVAIHPTTEDAYVVLHSGSTIYVNYYETTNLVQQGSTTTSFGLKPTRGNIGWALSGSTRELVCGFESKASAGSSLQNRIDFKSWQSDLTAGTFGDTFTYGGYIVSQIVSRQEFDYEMPYCVIGYDTDINQAFYSLIRINNSAYDGYDSIQVAKFLISNGSARPYISPSAVNFVDPDNFVFGSTSRVVSKYPDQDPLYERRKIVRASFDFSPSISSVGIGKITCVGAGSFKYFESYNMFPVDFNNYPKITNNASYTTGGNLSDGTYLFTEVYEATDSLGNIIRSAPSIPISVTLTGGTSTQRIIVLDQLPYLFEVDTSEAVYSTPLSHLKRKFYRTTNGGSIFYLDKIAALAESNINGGYIYATTVLGNLTDANLTDEETLYTIGGEVENIPLPSVNLLETHKNRLFVAGADEPRKVYYSKEYIQGEIPGFYSDFSKTYSSDITAIKSLDDNIYIFGSDELSYIAGDGPDSTGNNDTFTDFIPISADIGCINSKSAVSTDLGIFFESRRGIYLLGRNRDLSYIGGAVEDVVAASTINKAVNLPKKNEVRFLLDNDKVLVYNYEFSTWCTHTGFSNLVDIASTETDFYTLASNGAVQKETSGTYTDNSTNYSLKITTGWITLGQLNQLKRVYDLFILGNYKSAHTLNIEVAYDYDDTVVDSKTWNTATGLTDGDTNYQIRVRPSKQKFEAVKVTIYDNNQSGTSQSYDINALTIVAGMKGTNRQIKSIKSI